MINTHMARMSSVQNPRIIPLVDFYNPHTFGSIIPYNHQPSVVFEHCSYGPYVSVSISLLQLSSSDTPPGYHRIHRLLLVDLLLRGGHMPKILVAVKHVGFKKN